MHAHARGHEHKKITHKPAHTHTTHTTHTQHKNTHTHTQNKNQTDRQTDRRRQMTDVHGLVRARAEAQRCMHTHTQKRENGQAPAHLRAMTTCNMLSRLHAATHSQVPPPTNSSMSVQGMPDRSYDPTRPQTIADLGWQQTSILEPGTIGVHDLCLGRRFPKFRAALKH